MAHGTLTYVQMSRISSRGADATAAAVGHPRVLRWVYVPAGRRDAGRAAGHGEDADARRTRAAPGLLGRWTMSVTDAESHSLIGAYALDALEPTERALFEQH